MTTIPQAPRQPNDAMTELIDLGVNMLPTLDRDLVATFLLRRKVHFAVVVRVLAEPGRRRTDRRHPGQNANCAISECGNRPTPTLGIGLVDDQLRNP
jgi:hypothetical protein